MLILALDTASPVASVALHDGSSVRSSVTAQYPMTHGESLAPAISRALTDSRSQAGDVTDIAVGVGPGPFTGLRIGIITALTLAETQITRTNSDSIRTHGVCSLDILAADVTAGDEFLVATDARRKEVFWARYDAQQYRLEGPGVDRPDDVVSWHGRLPAYGRGAAMYADTLHAQTGPTDPAASTLAAGIAHGSFIEHELRPLYLRRPDARPLPGR